MAGGEEGFAEASRLLNIMFKDRTWEVAIYTQCENFSEET